LLKTIKLAQQKPRSLKSHRSGSLNKGELINQVARAIDAARKPIKAEDVINAPLNEKSAALRRWRAQEKTDTALVSAEKAIKAIFESITGSLQKRDNVQVPGFGTFVIKQRQATTAYNFRTGENMQIPAKHVVGFNPGKVLKAAVANEYKKATEPAGKTIKKPVGNKSLPKPAVKAKKPGKP